MENDSCYYVYILVSEMDGSFYYGQTSDLVKRLTRHNAGLENYTKKKIPWKILWYTQLETRALAMKLERKLKNMKSQKRVMEYISNH